MKAVRDLRLARLCCVAALLFGCFAVPARAADDTLSRLGSDDYATRQRATRELLTDPNVTIDQLREWIAQAHSPEQRHRLLAVAQHHVIRQFRERDFPDEAEQGRGAAIGFSHDVLESGAGPGVTGGVVHVVSTLPGFPGYIHLQPGDLIIEVGNRPLPANLNPDEFKAILRRWRSGDLFSMTVLRDGVRTPVQLKLASMNALAGLYEIDEPVLREPYLSQWLTMQQSLVSRAEPTPVLEIPPDPTPSRPRPMIDGRMD